MSLKTQQWALLSYPLGKFHNRSTVIFCILSSVYSKSYILLATLLPDSLMSDANCDCGYHYYYMLFTMNIMPIPYFLLERNVLNSTLIEVINKIYTNVDKILNFNIQQAALLFHAFLFPITSY